MESKGTVIFSRGGDNSEDDIWDDSALITAYDRAIGTAKKIIREKREANAGGAAAAASGGSASESSSNVDKIHLSRRQNRNRKWKPNRNEKQFNHDKSTTKWSVGDRCSAVYSVDGMAYDAHIISIDSESGTCFVSYVDYGNEEEVTLDDLMPPMDPNAFDKKINNKHSKNAKQNFHGDVSGGSTANNRKSSHVRNPPSLSQWQTTSPHQRPSPFQLPPVNSAWNPTHIPPMGMPPPLPVFEEGVVDDEDAMASMLMAWYMCGYHSGYYQGLRQSKRQSDNSYP